jgi:hypothetical protein
MIDPLMVLLEIDPQRPSFAPFEGDASRAVDVDRIASLPTAQQMAVEAGPMKRFKRVRCIERVQS